MSIIYANNVTNKQEVVFISLIVSSDEYFPGTDLVLHSYYGGNGSLIPGTASRDLGEPGDSITYKITSADLGKKLVFAFSAPVLGEKISFTNDVVFPSGYENKGIYIDTIARADIAKQPSGLTIGNGDSVLTVDEIDAQGKTMVKVDLPQGLARGDVLYIKTNQGEEKIYELPQNVREQGFIELKVNAPQGEGNNELVVSANIMDRHGNSFPVKEEVYLLDTDPQATVELENVTADNLITVTEAGQDTITIRGKVEGDFNQGDQVRIFIDPTTYYTRYVDAQGNFSADVATHYLVNDADKTIKAVLTTHKDGKTFTFEGEKVYTVEDVVPSAERTQVTLDNITADNVINATESQQGTIRVSGRVSGEFNEGDQVRIFIDENTYYTRYVNANGEFSADVASNFLLNDADKTVYAVLTTTNAVGNTGTIRGEKQYSVDTTVDAQVTLDNITADNIINAAEAKGTIRVSGTVSGEFNVGDQVRIFLDKNTYYTRYVDENGAFSADVPADFLVKDADKKVYAVLTTTDAAGNSATIRGEKQYSVESVNTAVRGETIELRALNGDLGLYYGVSKSGSRYGAGDVSFTLPKGSNTYTTTDGDDRVFIGYRANGQAFLPGQAGSFSNWADSNTQYGTKTDGNKSISTLDTGAGNDYVRIRGDENQQTRVYLGEGNDQIDIRLKVTSAVSTAGAARDKNQAISAIFGESGDDIINIGGSIHNSLIYGGSGSDKINIGFGELGGGSLVGSTIIDLGSGRPMPAVYLRNYQDGSGRSLGNDNNIDSASDVNHLRIAVNVDPGARIYGGNGKDIINIGGRFNGKMELGAGDDQVTYVQGTGQINGGSGNDTVKITGRGAILHLKNFVEVETIDISGSGSNTLRVTSDAARADRTTVYVKGNRDDKVDFGNVSPGRMNLKEGNKGSWHKSGSTVKDGIKYEGYKFNYDDDTLVYVQANIQVV